VPHESRKQIRASDVETVACKERKKTQHHGEKERLGVAVKEGCFITWGKRAWRHTGHGANSGSNAESTVISAEDEASLAQHRLRCRINPTDSRFLLLASTYHSGAICTRSQSDDNKGLGRRSNSTLSMMALNGVRHSGFLPAYAVRVLHRQDAINLVAICPDRFFR
jgi:hypothetical protein